MHNHLALLREHGLGSYRDLLMGVSKDPAMLIWLDGNTNRKSAPNENYGRELLELFTLGIGNYTEDDVAAARAFTGWNLQDGAFFFNRNQHDFGPKTFLGQTGRSTAATTASTCWCRTATAPITISVRRWQSPRRTSCRLAGPCQPADERLRRAGRLPERPGADGQGGRRVDPRILGVRAAGPRER